MSLWSPREAKTKKDDKRQDTMEKALETVLSCWSSDPRLGMERCFYLNSLFLLQAGYDLAPREEDTEEMRVHLAVISMGSSWKEGGDKAESGVKGNVTQLNGCWKVNRQGAFLCLHF